MPRIAKVLLPLPLPEAFDYVEPEGMNLAPGDQVAAPLGPRRVRGVVTELRDAHGANRDLKPIGERLEDPPLPPTTLDFIRWAARYAVAPAGLALAMTLRGLRSPPLAPARRLIASPTPAPRTTPSQARVLNAATRLIAAGELARAAGVSAGVVRGLVKSGALLVREIDLETAGAALPGALEGRASLLNASQAAAAGAIESEAGNGFVPFLIDGVTGSGKTEVYLEAAARLITRDGRAQVLILLPEIALTEAVFDRVRARFGASPDRWHSGMPGPRRRRTWERVVRGEARILVGARSALFLPFARLRLIVVDEEHDGSYKQEDGFIYQARDFAVARAKIEDAAVALVSATPSLETLWNARTGRYRWLRLAERHGRAVLPAIRLLDLRRHPPAPGRWLSPAVVEAVAETLRRGEQALLFLNRRGYAPLVLCRACGERLKSPDSDSWLVEHRYSGRLLCHLTGFSMPKPALCPRCQAAHSLVSIGPGVERVAEEARDLFPEARLAVFSSDTVSDAAAARALIASMTAGEIDILVATQAAAKGHDFPSLTLAAVIDADLGLRGGDLRAAERTFQLLTQVAGRAGRRSAPGTALLQTWAPNDPVMAAIAAGDRDGFADLELGERQAAGLPPFGRLAAVILSGADGAGLDSHALAFAAAAPNTPGVDIFGPADAPLAVLRGRRRKRLLARADRGVDLSAYLAAWRARIRTPAAVRVTIDVDPYSFL